MVARVGAFLEWSYQLCSGSGWLCWEWWRSISGRVMRPLTISGWLQGSNITNTEPAGPSALIAPAPAPAPSWASVWAFSQAQIWPQLRQNRWYGGGCRGERPYEWIFTTRLAQFAKWSPPAKAELRLSLFYSLISTVSGSDPRPDLPRRRIKFLHLKSN